MATYSVDRNIRKKIFNIPNIMDVQYIEPFSRVPTLTNSSVVAVANTILTRPQLITRAELLNLGKDIRLVGYNPLLDLVSNSNKTFSSKLLNWTEPYDRRGSRKTLFYTEVNSELKVGDRVFIINGAYDSDLLIEKNIFFKHKYHGNCFLKFNYFFKKFKIYCQKFTSQTN